ncbi:transposase [Candidatus Uhrbacteria bacterium]|nr:transposase [Candidatus Uhrbacteria bacterium]
MTFVTKNRDPIFLHSTKADLLRGEFSFYARLYQVELMAWVIMPNHVHMIVWPQEEKTVSDFLRGVKGHFAKQNGAGSIWQEGFYDYLIQNEIKLEEKFWYIARNPIEDKLAGENETYPYLYLNPDYVPPKAGSGDPAYKNLNPDYVPPKAGSGDPAYKK